MRFISMESGEILSQVELYQFARLCVTDIGLKGCYTFHVTSLKQRK